MPLCTCQQCLISTNGEGKDLHKSTIKKHMKRDQENKELENEFQNLHSKVELPVPQLNEESEDFNHMAVEESKESDSLKISEDFEERNSIMEISEDFEERNSIMEITEDFEERNSRMEISEDFEEQNFIMEVSDNQHEYQYSDSQGEECKDDKDDDCYESMSDLEDSDSDSDNNNNLDLGNISEDKLIEGLRLLYVKSNFNFSEAAFNNIMKAFDKEHNNISLYKIKKHLSLLVPEIEAQSYDMCINSCSAFTGILENDNKCKYCNENRYYSNGKSRKQFSYISIIERLRL